MAMDTMKWIGVGLGALFGATVLMLVRSASGSSVEIEGMPTGEAESLTPDWTDEDFKTLAAIARRHKINPADMLLIMASEAGLKPYAAYKSDTGYPIAVGLVQFTSVANDLLGITELERTQIPSMSVSEQLPLVDVFYAGQPWTKAGKKYDSAGVLYEANFAPGRMFSRGTSPGTILYEEAVDGPAYSMNKGFDKSQDPDRVAARARGEGYITVGDLIEHIRGTADQPIYRAGLQRLRNVLDDQSISPGLPSS